MAYSDIVKKTRVKITQENNDRARRMERRLATRLGGNRVPMSGGGFMKGDIYVNTPSIKYIVECKTSAMQRQKTPAFSLKFAYLEKLAEEVRKMNVEFGILIFHMHNSRKDYVVIENSYLDLLTAIDPAYYAETRLQSSGKSYTLREPTTLQVLTDATPFLSIHSTLSGISYTIMALSTFESIMESRFTQGGE